MTAILDRALALAADRLDGIPSGAELVRARSLAEHAGPLDLACALNPSIVRTPALELLSAELERVISVPGTRLIASFSPQEGKSSMARAAVLRGLQRDPERRVAVASYAADLARASSLAIRQMIEVFGSDAVDEATGLPEPDRLGLAIAPDQGAAGGWRLRGHQGGVIARGVGSGLTGRPVDLLVVDDPIKDARDADSATIRGRLYDWWTSVSETRLSPAASVVVIATRWHEDDLSGWLIKNDERGEWRVVNIPALADGKTPDALNRAPGEWMISARGRTVGQWEAIRRRVGERTFCTPAETPILMADWTTRPISQIRPGDEVMGYRHGGKAGGKLGRLALEPTVVEATSVRDAPVQTMHMESGATVRCTAEHRWYTGRNSEVWEIDRRGGREVRRNRPMYAPAKVGTKLYRFDPPLQPLTEERQRLLDYLAGMIDGEGTWGDSALFISQSPDSNPEVYDKIRGVLAKLDLQFREYVRPHRDHPHWGRSGTFVVGDAKAVAIEMLRRTDMAKAGHALAKLLARPTYPTRFQDRVERIEPGPVEPVYALQTGTGNYVAWGYASSNSALYQGRPAPLEGGAFRTAWFDTWRVAEPPPGCLPPTVVVDPADNEGDGDEAGLIVATAEPTSGRVFLLDDLSAPMTVARWARLALLTCVRRGAPTLAYEKSLSQLPRRIREAWTLLHQQALACRRAGGDVDAALARLVRPDDSLEARAVVAEQLAELAPADVDAVLAFGETGPRLRPITARGSKQLRMQLAAPKFETGRAVIVGRLPQLEHQLSTWAVGQDSPDRADAAIHAVELLGGTSTASIGRAADRVPTRSTTARTRGGSRITRSIRR